MKRTYQFLKDAGTFYLATIDEGQPRVRPFGAVCIYNNRLYICTNNKKDCFKQMLKNDRIEISAMYKGDWIRLMGTVVADGDSKAREAMLEANPSLRKFYSNEDGLFEVLFLTNAKATFCSFTKKTETEEFQ
jgi:uncharacterized pyridoxamine 5'-phosphate oxidase family protein